jgi:hypothetical protein
MLEDIVKLLSKLERKVTHLERREGAPITVPTNLVIASGAVTVTRPYHTLEPESGTADDLATINGGKDGKLITLRVKDSGDTITVKDGTGNLQLAGDFAMDNRHDTIQLIYDATLTAWLELSRSNNS